MKHRVSTRRLSRDKDHRRALIRNLSTSLVMHESIETTVTKAKFFKPNFEKLVTKAKNNKNLHGIKYARTKLTTEEAITKLFDEIVPMFEDRNGGYTRIIKLGFRNGDNAQKARIELVKPKKEEKKKSTKTSKTTKNEKSSEKKVKKQNDE